MKKSKSQTLNTKNRLRLHEDYTFGIPPQNFDFLIHKNTNNDRIESNANFRKQSLYILRK